MHHPLLSHILKSKYTPAGSMKESAKTGCELVVRVSHSAQDNFDAFAEIPTVVPGKFI